MNPQINPSAYCRISGNREYRHLTGLVYFYETKEGILVKANIKGLPVPRRIRCNQPIFGFHIHEGQSCTGTIEEPFKDALGHFNPFHCPHPYHAGDLPPLFATQQGNAMMSVVLDRFNLNDVIARTMIIHANADDFTTQPSGNSGPMIACGRIARSIQPRLDETK